MGRLTFGSILLVILSTLLGCGGSPSNSPVLKLPAISNMQSSTSAAATRTSSGVTTEVSASSKNYSTSPNRPTRQKRPANLLSIPSQLLPNPTVGVTYSATLVASGGTPPYQWAITSGALPSGLSLNASTGAIAGTPTTSGPASFTVSVSDAGTPPQSASRAFSVTVLLPITISTTSLANGTVNTAYSSTLAASGGVTPYQWSIASGSLPAGLSLNASTGVISGTPTQSGTLGATFAVQDSTGTSATANLSISIATAAAALQITTAALPGGTVDSSYSTTLTATGGTPPYTWSISSGSLPSAIALASTSGVISGIPYSGGDFSFTAQVHDSAQTTTNKSLTLSVSSTSFDQYGGLTSQSSPTTSSGYFRTEKVGSRWQFTTPDNHFWWMLGMVDITPSSNAASKYGDSNVPNWASATLARLQAWNFNAVGYYSTRYVTAIEHDNSLPGDHWISPALPFTLLARPSWYGMLNTNKLISEPLKDFTRGNNSSYDGAWKPSGGEADYFDPNLYLYLDATLNGQGPQQYNGWGDLNYAITNNPARVKYLVAIASDESDQTFSFGNGPDFTTYPVAGKSHAHGGWRAATVSPLQTANNLKSSLYPTTKVWIKAAWRDYLKGLAKYQTGGVADITKVNAAWGSNYTTFDTSGTVQTAEAVGSGNGSQTTFTTTLANPAISKYSLQVFVNGVPVAGDVCTLFNSSDNWKPCTNSVTTGVVWGPTVSGSITYSTGALSITFSTPPSGPITVNYVQNGWGIGTGLLDEDGRHAWFGNSPGNTPIYLTNVNPNVASDLDGFLYVMAKYYFSTAKSHVLSWANSKIPGWQPLFVGPDVLFYWNVPSNRNVLKAAGEELDIINTTGYPLPQAQLDFVGQYLGADKPLVNIEYRTANPDSAMSAYPNPDMSPNYTTQAQRGQAYYDAITTMLGNAYSSACNCAMVGTRPYIGTTWFAWMDGADNSNYGLVSPKDNAYDGKEATTGTHACSVPIASYTCGGEASNYGDVITKVSDANKLWQTP